MFKNILVPTDGSEFSRDTIRRAAAFAKETGATITAFYAKPERMMPYYVEGIGTNIPTGFEEADERLAKEILGFVETTCAEAGVKCTAKTKVSNIIYEAIIETAKENDCDLIFMASHGRRGFSALLLGSETTKVLTHSKIPVLVCR